MYCVADLGIGLRGPDLISVIWHYISFGRKGEQGAQNQMNGRCRWTRALGEEHANIEDDHASPR